ncbi:MAG: PQQ-binding-like beta-propeller repeat protein, partial [Bythopirellula sp.]
MRTLLPTAVVYLLLLQPLTLLAERPEPQGPAALGPWPQWRGPNRDDLNSETGLLQAWPTAGPERLWSFRDCGVGYAGPAVVGDRLYILGSRNNQEALLCIDVNTGKELWATPIGPELENSWGNGPRSTPTVDGELIYAVGGRGNLVCMLAQGGSVVWSKAMQ